MIPEIGRLFFSCELDTARGLVSFLSRWRGLYELRSDIITFIKWRDEVEEE
jgi:hypothetical protein